jgi:hypothetical protein
MTPARVFMVMAVRIEQAGECDIGSVNSVHGAPAPVRAMTHRAPDALHPVTILDELAFNCRAVHKNSPAIVGVAGRDYHGASER